MASKIKGKERRLNIRKTRYTRLRLTLSALILSVSVISIYSSPPGQQVQAAGCPDLKILFARGSGGERYTSGDYLAFKEAMEEKLAVTDLTYEFDDLDYPAVSIDVGDGHLGTLLGAYFGGGEAYEFGDSVHKGTKQLLKDIDGDVCKSTKYILAGYSQGAIVILDALDRIAPGKIVYAATFGDPKIYLPEGMGPVPPACGGKNLSEYRIYVPDCRAFNGILGARNPYILNGYAGKIGTWCNRYDILCSSYLSVDSHTNYARDGLYEDASRFIMSKIGTSFGISNQYTSPHDTAILIDSTGSMNSLLNKYKDEAMRLAEKTLESGGRVALYDYRDLKEGYVPVERCNFETCTLESFRAGLDKIRPYGGGDAPESLLSASFQVMKQLNWNLGSTKSLIILTDDTYHEPDIDGTTFYDVQKLSKQIDPVNFYIITPKAEAYQALAEATGGAVASSMDDLGLLTDSILERFDSLPRVEEEFKDEHYENDIPVVNINHVEEISDEGVKISFTNSGEATVVILNGGIIGTTYEKEITITGLKTELDNQITLVPLSATRRGTGVTIEKPRSRTLDETEYTEDFASVEDDALRGVREEIVIPKAPNTGQK